MSPELLLLLRTIHLVAIIVWIGGVICAGFVVGFAGESDRTGIASAVRSAFRTVVNPAMIVAWLAGLAVLFHGWDSLYMRAGWMHGKLTLALVLSGLTGVLAGRLRKGASDGSALRPSVFRGFAVGFVVAALCVVTLAKFRFGS